MLVPVGKTAWAVHLPTTVKLRKLVRIADEEHEKRTYGTRPERSSKGSPEEGKHEVEE